jgi:hypothetical protein
VAFAAEFATDEFYAAVGRTLLRWRRVEDAVYGLFFLLLAPLDQQTIAAIWNAQPSLHSRLKLISAILDEALQGSAVGREWRIVQSEILDAAATRNRLAHSDVGLDAWDDDGTVAFTLTDPTPRHRRQAPDLPLQDIMAASERFASLAERVRGVDDSDLIQLALTRLQRG